MSKGTPTEWQTHTLCKYNKLQAGEHRIRRHSCIWFVCRGPFWHVCQVLLERKRLQSKQTNSEKFGKCNSNVDQRELQVSQSLPTPPGHPLSGGKNFPACAEPMGAAVATATLGLGAGLDTVGALGLERKDLMWHEFVVPVYSMNQNQLPRNATYGTCLDARFPAKLIICCKILFRDLPVLLSLFCSLTELRLWCWNLSEPQSCSARTQLPK